MKPLASLPTLFALLLFILASLHLPPSWAASDSAYDTFLRCLTNRTQPSDHVSDIVYSQANSSFASVLVSYIRNSRFNSSSTRKVTVFRVEKTLDQQATDLVHKWQSVAPSTDHGLFMRLLLQPVTSKTQKGQKTIRASVVALFLGNSDQLVAITDKELPEMGLKKENCIEMSWIESVLWWIRSDYGTNPSPETLLGRDYNTSFLKRKSDYVQTPISKANLEFLWKKMIELGKVGLVFNPYRGRMSEIPASATPFPHRAGNLFKIQYSINWSEDDPELEKNYLEQARSLHSFMTPYV
ncbi:hypothetical protein NL676_012369 [Syzygium grande]|nr:hypothetical protein NL676_012369 [Syzygium grande]